MEDCVLLADGHLELSEGVRGLLGTVFESVFTVTDQASLLVGAARIQPSVVVADLALSGGDIRGFLDALRSRAPAAKVLLLTVHGEPNVVSVATAAGAHGIVLTRAIATDLLPAIEAILAGQPFSSSAFIH